jgi:hypothetical protein
MLKKTNTYDTERGIIMNEKIMQAHRSLMESISLAEDIARLYLEDEGLYNDLMYFHDKVIANNITEYELVTVMLIGEDLRETDASVANCLDIDCLELISLLREANGLRKVG